MNKKAVVLRTATVDDAQELLKIYTPYVKKTAISFEYEVPSLEDFKIRIKNILKKYPYLVAEENGEILGYAYTSAFAGRAAYDWSAAVTIYLQEDKRKLGLGRKLYTVLENISRAQNIQNLYACIAQPEIEDEYLTKNSVQFHQHLGYQPVGKFHNCGYKFGRWYDMVWMEKILEKYTSQPVPVIYFQDLSREVLHDLGIQ